MKDKVIVITGASAGIGAALAEAVAARGAKGIVLAARRKPELDALAAKLGPTALAVVADVSKRADNERLAAETIAKFGQLDVWVANAGRGITRLPSQLTEEDVDDMITTNLKSVLYGIQAVLPHFKERKRGHLITVSSMLGRIPMTPIRSAYSAAKAAVNSLMVSARLEVKPEFPGIELSTVFPGVVATEFGLKALHGGPDSRGFPGAQPAADVATIIAELIETPRAEVYTRPEMRDGVGRYFAAEDVAPIEASFAMPRRP